jgi:O-antigen ligase
MQPSVSRSTDPFLPAWTRPANAEQEMHVIAQGSLGAASAARVVLVFAAIAVVAFWRVLLRLVLALTAIAVLVAVGTGVVALVNAVHP